MEYSNGVRGRQCVRDLPRIPHTVLDAQRASSEHASQRRARHVLHGNEVDVAVPADVVDRDDVRMVEARKRPSPHESNASGGLAHRAIGAQALDRNRPVETCINGAVNEPHPALTDRLQDLVVRDRLCDHRRDCSIHGLGCASRLIRSRLDLGPHLLAAGQDGVDLIVIEPHPKRFVELLPGQPVNPAPSRRRRSRSSCERAPTRPRTPGYDRSKSGSTRCRAAWSAGFDPGCR